MQREREGEHHPSLLSLTCNRFAVLMSLSLYMGLAGIAAIVQLVAGVQTEPIVENPLLASTSPSDFWGRRWNRLVHNGLKVRRRRGEEQLVIWATD